MALTISTPEAAPYIYSEDNFDGYRAAPILAIEDIRLQEHLRASQDRLVHHMDSLVRYEISHYAKQGVVDFVSRSILGRMYQRVGMNDISYTNRANKTPIATGIEGFAESEVTAASEALLRGRGSVVQNELGRIAYGMSTSEYTNLTVIGRARRDLEAPMWDEVSAFIGSDATPHPEQYYRMSYLGFDRDITEDANVSAMRFGVKRRLGATAAGAVVKSRTTVIFKIIPAFRAMGLSDAEIRETIMEFQETERYAAIPDWLREPESDSRETGVTRRIDTLPAFQSAVTWLLTNRADPEIELARNETVYGSMPNTP